MEIGDKGYIVYKKTGTRKPAKVISKTRDWVGLMVDHGHNSYLHKLMINPQYLSMNTSEFITASSIRFIIEE